MLAIWRAEEDIKDRDVSNEWLLIGVVFVLMQ